MRTEGLTRKRTPQKRQREGGAGKTERQRKEERKRASERTNEAEDL